MSKEAQEAIQRLQMAEQNLHSINVQKQQFQAQLFELEGALKELSTAPSAYKIVGGIMVASDKDVLLKELEGRKELVELRVQTMEKQEKQLKDKAKKLQEEVMSSVKE